jgi:hypothetical protein
MIHIFCERIVRQKWIFEITCSVTIILLSRGPAHIRFRNNLATSKNSPAESAIYFPSSNQPKLPIFSYRKTTDKNYIRKQIGSDSLSLWRFGPKVDSAALIQKMTIIINETGRVHIAGVGAMIPEKYVSISFSTVPRGRNSNGDHE